MTTEDSKKNVLATLPSLDVPLPPSLGWSIVNRNPVDPCDPDLVTDLCPNEMIELYIDEESKNPIS